MSADIENDLDHVTPAPEPVADIRDIAAAALETQREDAPAGETAEEKADRLRDKIGRFATPDKAVERQAKEAQVDPTPKVTPAAQTAPTDKAVDPPADATTAQRVAPPVGWSPAAKAEFDKLSPAVQQAVAKREDEVNQGFRELQDWKPIKPFHDLLKQHGRDLPTALKVYTEIDQVMSRDLVNGFEAIANNVQVPIGTIVAEWARRNGLKLSRADGSETPNEDPAAAATLSQEDQLARRLGPIEQAVQSIINERVQGQARQAEQTVAEFWADPANKYAENVSGIMTNLIRQAKSEGRSLDLKAAYEEACWQHPEVRAILINERVSASAPAASTGRAVAAASTARAAAKATVGAPSPGFTPGAAIPQFATAADAARYAYDQQKGKL